MPPIAGTSELSLRSWASSCGHLRAVAWGRAAGRLALAQLLQDYLLLRSRQPQHVNGPLLVFVLMFGNQENAVGIKENRHVNAVVSQTFAVVLLPSVTVFACELCHFILTNEGGAPFGLAKIGGG